MAEEPTYTTEQVDELIHAGLGTVDFFLSRPIDAQSSLGKGSIPPGVTAVLTSAAEAKSKPVATGPVKPRRKKVISNATPYTVADNIPPEKLPINTPIPNPLLPLARPQGKMTDIDIVTGTITEGSYKGVELAKLGKQTLLTRFTSNEPISSAGSAQDPNFKRGGANRERARGNHRREWSIAWVGDQVKVFEWCNPRCAPVTASARKFTCTCGSCPSICGECEGDH
uniref:Phosphoprotein n=1 Tax=Human parainfluenza 2 virus TaxID=2560525 RepID=A0A1V0E1Z8_PI2H|nr:phosphoprotein [Human orthorubulavirus 2]